MRSPGMLGLAILIMMGRVRSIIPYPMKVTQIHLWVDGIILNGMVLLVVTITVPHIHPETKRS